MTGGMLGDISLFTLGIAPYVSSNLIIDLLGKIIPTLFSILKIKFPSLSKFFPFTSFKTFLYDSIVSSFVVIISIL